MRERTVRYESSPTVRAVLEQLARDGLLDREQIDACSGHLEAVVPHPPWYIQAAVGFAAWLAALWFIGALSIARLIDDSAGSLLLWGVLFLVAGIAMRRSTEKIFLLQLSLALNIAGKGLVIAGAHQLFDESWAIPLASTILLAVTYPLSRDTVDRFVSTLVTVVVITGWIILEGGSHHTLHLLVLAEVVGIGVLLMQHPTRAAAPMGYAVAVGLLGTLVFMLSQPLETPLWPSRAILAAGLVVLFAWAAGGLDRLKREPLLVAVIVTVLLGFISTPGLLATLGLLVLGYARDDRALMGLALTFLPGFIFLYYYHLEVDLAYKSWVLAGSGAALLGARAWLRRRPWAGEEG